VNRPALVKTSHQPSFSSSNFSSFNSADALRSSDISPVPSLNLIQITWWNSKQNNEFNLQKNIFLGKSERENQAGH
jgi:hypothetical protein